MLSPTQDDLSCYLTQSIVLNCWAFILGSFPFPVGLRSVHTPFLFFTSSGAGSTFEAMNSPRESKGAVCIIVYHFKEHQLTNSFILCRGSVLNSFQLSTPCYPPGDWRGEVRAEDSRERHGIAPERAGNHRDPLQWENAWTCLDMLGQCITIPWKDMENRLQISSRGLESIFHFLNPALQLVTLARLF